MNSLNTKPSISYKFKKSHILTSPKKLIKSNIKALYKGKRKDKYKIKKRILLRDKRTKRKIRSIRFIKKIIFKRPRFKFKSHSLVYLIQTSNNFFITLKNKRDRIIFSKSNGTTGFKGPRRLGVYATTALTRNALIFLKKNKYRTLTIVLRSKLTKNIKEAIRVFSRGGIKIFEIIEKVPRSHNGLRHSSQRRV